jgi:hypothetical protein
MGGIKMLKIKQVAEFKSCLTCAYRRSYPPSNKKGQQIFDRFLCANAAFSSRELIKPEEVCDFWQIVTLDSSFTNFKES